MEHQKEILEFIRKFENHIDFDFHRLVIIYNEVLNRQHDMKESCYTCKKRIIRELKEYLNANS